jgi:hypothetical protein
LRVRKNLSSGMPDATSMTRPSVSNPAPGLYVQREPGWNSSVVPPSRGMYCASVSPSLRATLSMSLLPIGPLPRPGRVREQILDRDLALRGHGVERRACPPLPRPTPIASRETPTFMLRNSGMKRATGSLSRTFPSSTSIMIAVPTTGLGHRRDANHVRRRHAFLRFQVRHALCREVHDLPAPRDGRDRTGEIAASDAPLNHLRDALQALGRDADFLGLAGRPCRSDRGEQEERGPGRRGRSSWARLL